MMTRNLFVMRQAKMILYRCQARSMEEAQVIAFGLQQLDGCVDTFVSASCSVEAYFEVESRLNLRNTLPEGCRVIPTPAYWPGDLAILQWPFPGAHQYNQVRIAHLCNLRGSAYRYFIIDQQTQKGGWIDAPGLEPLTSCEE